MVAYLFHEKYTTGESTKDVEESTVSGLRIYDMFKKYTLDNEKNYQQCLTADPTFKSYLSVTVNTKKKIFAEFHEEHNAAKVDMICQDIMYVLYTMLSKASYVPSDTSTFEQDVLNFMQMGDKSLVDAIFK